MKTACRRKPGNKASEGAHFAVVLCKLCEMESFFFAEILQTGKSREDFEKPRKRLIYQVRKKF